MMWQRPELFEIWAAGAKRLQADFPEANIEMVVAGSEGQKTRDIVEGHGFNYVEALNEPLGHKANVRLQWCKILNPTHVLLLGSDDLMSSTTLAYVLDKMNEGFDEVCAMDLYLHSTAHNETVYSEGYTNHRRGEPMAVGRCMKSWLLDQLNWTLWPDNIKRGLDGFSRDTLATIPHARHTYWLKEQDLAIIDIKHETNLSKWTMRPNWEKVGGKILAEHFPNEVEQIMNL